LLCAFGCLFGFDKGVFCVGCAACGSVEQFYVFGYAVGFDFVWQNVIPPS
jgi:hypothetical protein